MEAYHEAREKFVAAAEAAGLRHMRHRVPYEDTPELFIDFALRKSASKRLLVHIGGVHGIEGYAGSLVQQKILAALPTAEHTSLLFVHALNPYGMAFHRRANGNNVDLNRNFSAGKICHNADYSAFATYLNPQSRWEFLRGGIEGALAFLRLGKAKSTMAIAMGQSDFPRGLFFTGRELQREILLFQNFLRAHFSEVEEVFAIDLHTGLGPHCGELLFVDPDLDPEAAPLFEKIYARPITRPDHKAGIYEIFGRLSNAIRAALPQAHLHYTIQEFGTSESKKVLAALRLENFEWHRRRPYEPPSAKVKEQMLAAFFPEEKAWRENLLALGETRWRQCWSHLESLHQSQ